MGTKLQLFILGALLLFFYTPNYAQTFTDSNLPIVVITTDLDPLTNQPLEIIDDPRILASMKIIYHNDGSRNYMSDANTTSFLNYNGRINIEIRGSSSQDLPKKSYGLTTLKADNISNNNVSILGMPAENDWVLNSIPYDGSKIRDYFCYNLSRNMGNYATRTQYCEVVINGNYKGLYIWQEKIKANDNRVNITKITNTDNTLPNITGGYITKCDKTTGGDPVAWTMSGTKFIHELPKPENVTPEQNTYIHDEFFRLANTTYNFNTDNGYKSVIDIPSFVDFMLVNELASNSDVYEYSTFFHKDRNGKLRAGPVWDLNQTFGNSFNTHSVLNEWQFHNNNKVGADFWYELFDNGQFTCEMAKRLNELRQPGKAMNTNNMFASIDNTVAIINEALTREQLRWGTVPNLSAEIASIKNFITTRLDWMTANLGPFASCSNVILPPLVISKINYNPVATNGITATNDLEFIEITNNSNNAVNLTGIYIKELGLTYQFPINASINANQAIYLASNVAAFQTAYGFPAFDQYSRNLSNKSYKLTLADANGNTIDTVEYFDSAPWPVAADGNGSYLKLRDLSLDNNMASSWEAVNETLLSSQSFTEATITIFPNPTSETITIKAPTSISTVEVYDVYGKLVKSDTLNAFESVLNYTSLSSGIYLLKIKTDDRMLVKKLTKK